MLIVVGRKPDNVERPFVAKDVVVTDITGREEEFRLDNHGFQVYKHTSKEKEFVDDGKIKGEYYPEVEQLLKDA